MQRLLQVPPPTRHELAVEAGMEACRSGTAELTHALHDLHRLFAFATTNCAAIRRKNQEHIQNSDFKAEFHVHYRILLMKSCTEPTNVLFKMSEPQGKDPRAMR